MAEYIDRDMFLKMISHKPSSPTTDREDRLINGFISAVKNCPAADVRPVVMCRDCKYYCKDADGYEMCDNSEGYDHVSEDGFCAWAVKWEES